MKQKEKLLIAGGDLRQLYCALKLSERYDTAITGFDKKYTSAYPQLKTAESEAEALFDCAVLPVPPLGDGELLNTPCSEKKISIPSIKPLLKENGIIFTGRDEPLLRELFPRCEIIDYMKREELCLLNAVPTAEGAVQLALEELPVTLSGAKVLIVGCGRIGTALINILKGFGADITVAVRNARGTAKAKLAGVKCCCTQDIPAEYRIVFNTAPTMIFDREKLSLFDKDTLFIDLASKPGGFDFDEAAQLGLHTIWALGLPGKTAPITSGEIIADTINGILSERGVNYG